MSVTTSTSNPLKINLGPWFIAFAALLWTTDTLVRTNLEASLASTQIVFLEHLIIIIIISPLIVKNFPKLMTFNAKEIGSILFIGVGGSALATILLTEGFFTGDFPYQFVAIVILLQQTQPLIAITFSHLFLKERLPKFYYFLAPIALLGIFLIIFPYFYDLETGAFGLLDLTHQQGLIAGLLGLTAAFLWGSSTVFGRYLMNHSDSKPEYLEMTTFRFLIAAVFLILFTPLLPKGGYPSFNILTDTTILTSILYLAIVVGLISLIIYYYGLKTTHASISTISELAYPLSFFVIMPFLGLSSLAYPTITQFAGGFVLIIASTILSYNYGKITYTIHE